MARRFLGLNKWKVVVVTLPSLVAARMVMPQSDKPLPSSRARGLPAGIQEGAMPDDAPFFRLQPLGPPTGGYIPMRGRYNWHALEEVFEGSLPQEAEAPPKKSGDQWWFREGLEAIGVEAKEKEIRAHAKTGELEVLNDKGEWEPVAVLTADDEETAKFLMKKNKDGQSEVKKGVYLESSPKAGTTIVNTKGEKVVIPKGATDIRLKSIFANGDYIGTLPFGGIQHMMGGGLGQSAIVPDVWHLKDLSWEGVTTKFLTEMTVGGGRIAGLQQWLEYTDTSGNKVVEMVYNHGRVNSTEYATIRGDGAGVDFKYSIGDRATSLQSVVVTEDKKASISHAFVSGRAAVPKEYIHLLMMSAAFPSLGSGWGVLGDVKLQKSDGDSVTMSVAQGRALRFINWLSDYLVPQPIAESTVSYVKHDGVEYDLSMYRMKGFPDMSFGMQESVSEQEDAKTAGLSRFLCAGAGAFPQHRVHLSLSDPRLCEKILISTRNAKGEIVEVNYDELPKGAKEQITARLEEMSQYRMAQLREKEFPKHMLPLEALVESPQEWAEYLSIPDTTTFVHTIPPDPKKTCASLQGRPDRIISLHSRMQSELSHIILHVGIARHEFVNTLTKDEQKQWKGLLKVALKQAKGVPIDQIKDIDQEYQKHAELIKKGAKHLSERDESRYDYLDKVQSCEEWLDCNRPGMKKAMEARAEEFEELLAKKPPSFLG